MNVSRYSMRKALSFVLVKAKIVIFNTLFSPNRPTGTAGYHLVSPVTFKGRGKIYIHNDVMLGCSECTQYLSSYNHIEARNLTSVVEIQESVAIANNVYICADYTSITIGKDTVIGSNVQIIDSDFHSREKDFSLARSQNCHAKPIEIGDNVFIGNNVIILKGVTVGSHSTIGAGSVVTQDIPCSTVAAGNPARIIKAKN
jgi:maltose O-acetyltransferase